MQGLHLRGPACQMQGCSGQQQQAIPKPARVSVQCKVARNQARSSPTASAAETQAPTTEIAPQKKDKVSFVSLGCPKNVVDGENVVDGFIAQTILHIKHTHTHARTHTHKHTHTHTHTYTHAHPRACTHIQTRTHKYTSTLTHTHTHTHTHTLTSTLTRTHTRTYTYTYTYT